MSLHIAKLFETPLALAGAALVIHIGAATAADSTGDIQQRMRDLLAGTIAVHSAPQSGARHDKVTARTLPTCDVQQQLLAGTIIAHSARQSGPRDDKVTAGTVTTGDIQQQMRDLLAGTPTAHSTPQSGPSDGARRVTASRVRTTQAPK
jgi:hypothetical protein